MPADRPSERWVGPVATLVAGLAVGLLYVIAWPNLADGAPVHIGAGSTVTRDLPAPLALLVAEGTLALAGAIFWITSARDSRLRRGRAAIAMRVAWVGTLGVLVAHQAYLLSGVGGRPSSGALLPAAIGIFLVFLGNFMPLLPPNHVVGIRTPWSRSSDRAWERTHRVGGRLCMLTGLAVLLGLAAPDDAARLAVVLGALVAFTVAAVAWSWWAARSVTGG